MPKQLLFMIKERLGDVIFQIQERSPKRIYMSAHKSDLKLVAKALCAEFGGRFLTASGMDNGKNFEILYHFAFDDLNKIISIRTFVQKAAPSIDSIVSVVGPAAEWIEREMHELLGIEFAGQVSFEKGF
jgi:NADH-quinone oxidoreductase subunit C